MRRLALATVALLSTGALALEVGGSVRLLGAGLHTHEETRGLSQGVLRLTVQESLGERWRFEAHAVQQAGTNTGGAAARFRTLNEWRWADEPGFAASLGVDRLNARLRHGPVDLTVGRQALNLSKAYFWNPLDVFLPFDPRAFDRDYKPGVDALRLDLALGEASGASLIAVAGRTVGLSAQEPPFGASLYGSALLGRYFTTLGGFDLAVQAGKVYGGFQAGAGFSGELGEFGVRGEASVLLPQLAAPVGIAYPSGEVREVVLVPRHARAALGVDHRFENGLTLAVEYFFNGAVDEDRTAAAARFAAGEVPNLSRHLWGLLLSKELHPLLKSQLAALYSPGDFSALLSPAVVYSIADESELVAGALVGLGTGLSEFGAAPDVYFLEAKVYF